MSVNGLGLNQNLYAGIDTVNAAKVTGEIFTRAAQKTVDLSNIDLTQFKRPTIGVDFYSAKTSIELQRQIAIAQAGINTQSIDTSYLNAQAASALYQGVSVTKNVEGKLFIPTDNKIEAETIKNVFALPQKVEMNNIANLGKDAKGSNPFAYQPQTSEKEEEPLNIFA